jgi:hypothetical protein
MSYSPQKSASLWSYRPGSPGREVKSGARCKVVKIKDKSHKIKVKRGTGFASQIRQMAEKAGCRGRRVLQVF